MISLQNLVAKASQINKKIAKEMASRKLVNEELVEHETWTQEEADRLDAMWEAKKVKFCTEAYIKDIQTALVLRDAVRKLEEETGETLLHVPQGSKQAYFITVRPDTRKVSLHQFYNDVRKFVDRKCFIEYKLSFEQKGVSDETLGDGFHVHIVASMKQRSKGEVLRDTVNTFKGYTLANCVQVHTTRNPAELVENYLVNYQSDDGHKAPTQQWDAAWRAREGLANLYKSPDGMPIKSISASLQKVTTTVTF